MGNFTFGQQSFILKNSMKMTIREAYPLDAEDILDYLNLVGGESDNLAFGKNKFNLDLKEEIQFLKNRYDDPKSILLLCFINNELVSISGLYTSSNERFNHNSKLSLSVKKDFWDLGIGTIAVKELIEFAKLNGIKNINLGVKSDNLIAMHLYRNLGFKFIGSHKDFFFIDNIYYDEILMDLSLD